MENRQAAKLSAMQRASVFSTADSSNSGESTHGVIDSGQISQQGCYVAFLSMSTDECITRFPNLSKGTSVSLLTSLTGGGLTCLQDTADRKPSKATTSGNHLLLGSGAPCAHQL